MSQRIYIDRPPRLQPELPLQTVKIPAPPKRQPGGLMRLIQLALPLLTIVGFASITLMAGGGRSPLMLIPMALSVGAATVFSIWSYVQERRKQAEAERAYQARLVTMTREMTQFHDQQRRFYTHNYPDSAATCDIAREARAEVEQTTRTLRAEARLWERRTTDADFGVVRLGLGSLPSSVVYTFDEQGEGESDPLLTRAALKLQEDSRFVDNIPVIVTVRPPRKKDNADTGERPQTELAEEHIAQATPHVHALGIAGEREAAHAFARSLLAQYVVFHAPLDAKLYVLAQSSRAWGWTDYLPHCQGGENQQFTLFLDTLGRGAPSAAGGNVEVAKYLEGLRKVLAQRKLRLQETEEGHGADDPTLPFCLVVVDLLDTVYDPKSPLGDLESDPAISLLLKEGTTLGVAALFLVPERSKLPSDCQAVIEIQRTIPATNSQIDRAARLHFRYAETGVNSFRYVGAADYVSTVDEVNELAKRLAELDLRQQLGADLPSSVPFMTLLGYSSLAELEESAWKQWQTNAQPERADWLRARLGMMSGAKARTLVFSSKQDGVHGMVAGSTGSGKSELLISLIMAMAVSYDPTMLNFVLVDYKGGGAFKPFESLPHCVDIITNLGASGVTRMFSAIDAELKRRAGLLADQDCSHIVKYREKGLHETYQPLPFLFIIIDEFAELIADRAEYKGRLESITRVGRSLGVSLILAAQRPSGVTDQMRSNIKFRICLRVETGAESREMLRRTDAAYLPGSIPGRGFIQVGNDEIEPIQIAYCGEKYIDPGEAWRTGVMWPDRVGGSEADQERPELYKAIVTSLERLAREQGVAEQHAPWPAFLPTKLALTETLLSDTPQNRRLTAEPPDAARSRPLTAEQYFEPAALDAILLGQPREATLSLNPALNRWMDEGHGWVEPLDWERHALRPVVGLVDNPYAARQAPLVVDLTRGHAVVFGAFGWGKTGFLRSLVVSLAATHPPEAVRFYILDLGGHNLALLKALPHVDAVISPDEEGYREQVDQLLRELDALVGRRKTLFNTTNASDIVGYNSAHPTEPVPAVVVVIDNFIEFRETFGSNRDNVASPLDRLVELARECRPYGVHLVITANQFNVLSNQLYNLFTERFTLKLADTTEYRAIVGGQVDDIPDIVGRGYVSMDRQPLGFQVAQSMDLSTASETEEVGLLGQTMRAYLAATGRECRPLFAIGSMPRAVLFRQLLARQHNLTLDNTFLAQLKDVTRQRWAAIREPSAADWLRVTIGVLPGDRPRELQLEAKLDGVHGLVAGGTGSGKSELLMTLIVGLALNYPPDLLNFVLVDYKGGGAFKPFEGLPHCVDLVTNLNKAAVRRMFTAIRAEMERRQALNTATQTKDIVEYRAKGYHLTHAPYPHLFVIIDEFAEMISDAPDFRDALEGIARLGRAQGINLILASQRPIGVTDQMRANIKLRLCLRVEDVETSRELLRRSDAAALPSGQPGRGYLQVGNDNIELIQVAYCGDNAEATPQDETRPAKFYDAVVRLANELLEGEHPRSPWPPNLPTPPTTLALTDPLVRRYTPPALVARAEERGEPLVLNPALMGWIEGRGAWPGVNWESGAMRAVIGLVDDPYRARQLPLMVDFTRGHAVVFGASGWGKTTFIRSLVLSLAASHSPNEFQAHVLDLGGRTLESLRELPHVGTYITPDERGYEERVQQLWRRLTDMVDERKKLFSAASVSTLYEYNAAQPDRPQPAILVAIDNFAEYLETFGDAKGEAGNLLETLVGLIRQTKAYGVHFLVTAGALNTLSSKLLSLFTERLTLRLSNADDYATIVGSRVDEVEEIAGRGYIRIERQPLAFQVAIAPRIDRLGQPRSEGQTVRAVGEAMHAVVASAAGAYRLPLRIEALPQSVSYRQVLLEDFGLHAEGSFVAQLAEAVRARWAANRSAERSDWLKAVLGVTSGGVQRMLRLEAKRDGVHGLVAGGTGSGKSELLMTLIVGLALNYPPDLLNFVLVDYKGGGAFKPFEGLPHCVDIVTNLNKAAVDRMFTSISAEVERRQALNADTKTKDIIEYRRQGLHLTREPYPHLFVIIDEYAEMIDDNPDYKGRLESLTRVGRAQGVNLVLASQRPKGVTDQMRANIKLRLCLRVEEADTSAEMLRRPDAAYLPNGLPGRGYLQAGADMLELIQVAYCGETQRDDRPLSVVWPDRSTKASGRTDETAPKLFETAVNLTSELVGGKPAPKPWPAFLPTTLSLQSPLYDAQHDRSYILAPEVTDWLNGDTDGLWPGVDWQSRPMEAVVGLVDNPHEARQEPLKLDLRQHLAVYGDTGWGTTTFLRSLVVSLASTHSPDELHVYIMDLGGRNYRSLENLPHSGAVIYADEDNFEERLNRLLDRLSRLTDERQARLSAAGANNLYEFNALNPRDALPAVLVVIDNFAPLRENYEMLVENTLIPLVRRSLAAGVTFVLSANAPSHLQSKLAALFGTALTFKQNSSDRYLDIVGRGAIEIDDIPGRGYIRLDRRPLLFQAALPVGALVPGERDTLREADELALLGRHMWAKAEASETLRHRPDPIAVLPETAPLLKLLDMAPPPRRGRIEVVLGQGGDLRPTIVDLKRTAPHFIVAGPSRAGRTTVLYTWLLSLASRYPPGQVGLVLVDLQRRFVDYGGTRRLDELPHVITTLYEIEALGQAVTQIKAATEGLAASDPPREVFILIDNFDDTNPEIESSRDQARELLSVIRRFDREGLHCVVVGGLDSSASDLKRRIRSAGFGVALRSADTVGAFGVTRIPAALRGKEPPVGRGVVVRAGQTSLIQIASPYHGLPSTAPDSATHNGHGGGAPVSSGAPVAAQSAGAGAPVPASDDQVTALESAEEEESRMAQALDWWVEQIQARYPGPRPVWNGGAAAASAPKPTSPAQSKRLAAMVKLVRRAASWEMKRANGDLVVTPRVVNLDTSGWNDESQLLDVLKTAWRLNKQASGQPQAAIEILERAIDVDSLLMQLDNALPKE